MFFWYFEENIELFLVDMYLLYDIISVCLKLELLVFDEFCCCEEESLRLMNYVNGQMEIFVCVFVENNNGLMMELGQLDVYGKIFCVEMSVYEGIMINNMIVYEVKLMVIVVKMLFVDVYYGNVLG